MTGPRVLLRGCTVIDGLGGPPRTDGAVLVEGETITWTGPEASLPAHARDARAVDLGGRTLCPGFIDTHVHFALPGGTGDPLRGLNEPPTLRALRVLERLRVTLENGVTTARDLMGLDAGFREAVAERLVPGPRLLVSVAMLSQRAGHADFLLASGVDALAAAVTFPGAPGGVVDSVDELRRRVRDLVALGADCLKLASSGGVTSPHDQPDWVGMRPEMVAAAVEEAEAYGGLPVAVHAIGRPGIAVAVRGGVTSVEHGYALDDELRAEMVARGQFLVPTLLETMTDIPPGHGAPGAHEKSVIWHARAHESVAASVAAGVRVVLGTDSGLTPPHGRNLAELGLLVRLGGMTPLQAVTAGTAAAAELCGVADVTGSITAGKQADLVVAGVDPLTDIEALAQPANIHAVVKGGRVAVDRAGVLAGSGLPPLCPGPGG